MKYIKSEILKHIEGQKSETTICRFRFPHFPWTHRPLRPKLPLLRVQMKNCRWNMGLKWDCAGLALNSFPVVGSWIKSGISLDYSLWWPLRVLSLGYLKHSTSSEKITGILIFLKVQGTFRALITHSRLGTGSPLSHYAARDGILQAGICFLMADVDLITDSFPARTV